MVAALDHKPNITVEQIAEKTYKVQCHDCDWMETGGSQAVATRKKNKHAEEHRASLHGEPGVPTIMDEIEGLSVVPDIEEPPTPVRDLEYFRRMKEEAAAFNAKQATLPEAPCPWDCRIEHEHLTADQLEQAGTFTLAELTDDFANPVESLEDLARQGAIAMGLDPDSTKVEERTYTLRTHTRTQYFDGSGATAPDYCRECSEAIQDWVPWPCDAMKLNPGDRGYELPRTRFQLTTERLRLQKGPSDRDRDAWLAARAESVSATVVAKLGLAADLDFAITQLVNEALYGDGFTGNAYTEWGKHREPYLEAAGLERHGIVGESHLYFARTNRRHSASPDGIRIHPDTGDVGLGEYKTCGKELTLREVHAKGYFYQVQWQMYVLEASHCYLMWEWRENDGQGGFIATPGGEHLIMRDDGVIQSLIQRANRFLEALDRARGRQEQAAEPEEDPQLKALVARYLSSKVGLAQAETDLREYCEANSVKKVVLDGLGSVSYSWGSPRSSLDREALEADYPGLLEKYTKLGKAPERPTLRVRAKGESEDAE